MSFFGFDTKLPPLTREELAKLGKGSAGSGEDIEIYDYGGELDEEAPLELDETGDDLNDDTFGDIGAVGKDFDFAGSTRTFDEKISESEAFTVFPEARPKTKEEWLQQGSAQSGSTATSAFRNPWAVNSGPSSTTGPAKMGGLPVDTFVGAFNEPAPAVQSPSSIWGNFSAGRQDSHIMHQQPGFPGDFGSQPRPEFGRQGHYPQQALTLAEVEAAMQRGHAPDNVGPPPMPRQQFGAPSYNEPPKMMTVEELEASMRGMQTGPQPSAPFQQMPPIQAPPGIQGVPNGAFLFPPRDVPHMDERALQRERAVEDKIRAMASTFFESKYNGLMSRHDKDLVHRIQLQQLVSDDPYSDDFYYQVYSTLRQRSGAAPVPRPQRTGMLGAMTGERMTEPPPKNARGKREENTTWRMQQQVQRIVNDARRRPKQTQVSLEGALGKITLHSVRNPRQVLQVSKASENGGKDKSKRDSTKGSPADSPLPDNAETKVSKPAPQATSYGTIHQRRQLLRRVEDTYTEVLHLEQLRRLSPPAEPRPEHEEQHQDAVKRWNEDYGGHLQKLWELLKVTDPIGVTYPHPFIAFLSVPKAKKLVARIVRHLTPEQTLTMLTMLVANFDSLDVCQPGLYDISAPAGINKDVQYQIDYFVNHVIPFALGFISDAPFKIVLGLMAIFLDRNNIPKITKTKAGLAFLTIFLSRAEILKEQHVDDMELSQWTGIYNNLFSTLQNHFLGIFPPVSAANDTYVWQFLAAMAVGASMEQQHILVTEVREKVLQNVAAAANPRVPADEAALGIANTNLFLHALGLDASQVTVPS
ncbi:hypothetical protein BZG36_02406 [Bifiguratus adelaidae]|uniref:mRNA decay factor PAT1 domain-containing protein n=1 Tax=Bifiguratus adelaidae TaxID=1938954 RepID=A0A261Y192_9FUNG|nr:hypothetical protein BZG36_02406 [Bifiguratus adelaidae]